MTGWRTIHRLIEHFSTYTVVPIDPDEVRDKIISFGVKDEIEFVGVNLDTRIIYGAYHQYIRRSGVYTDPLVCADIYYDLSLTRDWRRLVCCKELLHLLNHSSSKTASLPECEALLGHLSEPNLLPFSEEKLQAYNDTTMMLYAIAILFPWDAREVLKEDWNADPTRIDEIVRRIDLPPSVVRLVLSDRWPRHYDQLAGRT
jgi:hypothetical protein